MATVENSYSPTTKTFRVNKINVSAIITFEAETETAIKENTDQTTSFFLFQSSSVVEMLSQ